MIKRASWAVFSFLVDWAIAITAGVTMYDATNGEWLPTLAAIFVTEIYGLWCFFDGAKYAERTQGDKS